MPSKPDANFIWSIANLLRGPYKPKDLTWTSWGDLGGFTR